MLCVLLRLRWVVEHLFEELELREGGEWEDEEKEEEVERRGCRAAERGHFPFFLLYFFFSFHFSCEVEY